ncbi:hypothetical protein VFPPC_17962 [Pochonia chlamydosporia 170]|uniref:Uncharacterized protein n=1 Tax=Pochonia chlamydosporia 170 TaxID=1380566 RepID=A0A219ARM0_METCM|nr:hypothetical protein VFPPC_17962 [Pochonia chlamydosporia 170]OWT42845.1 hypothetical protein VFPPC_17962 [Pochonia chlamydosporia 170]
MKWWMLGATATMIICLTTLGYLSHTATEVRFWLEPPAAAGSKILLICFLTLRKELGATRTASA